VAWRESHPDTLVLATGGGDPYYLSSQTGILGTKRADKRLAPKEIVLGVLQPAAKVYAFGDLERLGQVRDTLAGQQVEIVYDERSRTARAFRLTGQGREPLPATTVFWFAWVDFFPGAPLWRPASDAAPQPARERASPEYQRRPAAEAAQRASAVAGWKARQANQ